eukprot:9733697-Lingulodinium_polyedra.AAC.1
MKSTTYSTFNSVAVPTQRNGFMPGVGDIGACNGPFQSGASLDAGGLHQKSTMSPTNITMAPSGGRVL